MTDPIVERLTSYLASLQYEDLPSGASSTSNAHLRPPTLPPPHCPHAPPSATVPACTTLAPATTTSTPPSA